MLQCSCNMLNKYCRSENGKSGISQYMSEIAEE